MKADLHIHTTFSDGVSSPQEIVKAAIKKDIKCICITDHGEVEGAIRAMKFAFDKDILVIPGIEVTTTSGHILGINVKRAIPDGLSAKQTINQIRKQGGLAVIAHPFDWPIEDFLGGEEIIRAISPDGIEVFNAAVLVKSSNKKAFDFASRNNFCFTAGSDAHRADFIGRGYLEISDKVQSAEDLLREIRDKRVKPGGTPLSFWEILKMLGNNSVSFKKAVNYYKFRKKRERLTT